MTTEIYNSTNPSDWIQLEALYIAELPPPGFIQGVNLSTVGFAGQCVRGPLTPQVITSPKQFTDLYGERDYTTNGTGGALVGQVWAALLNKPFGPIVVRRVAAAAAVVATANLIKSGPVTVARVDASNPGIWANGATGGIVCAIEAATSGVSTQWNLRVSYLGKDTVYQNLDTSTGTDNTAIVLGDDVSNLVKLTKVADGRPDNATGINLASGTNGTINDTDYISGITDIANYKGVAVCIIPEAPPTPLTLNGTIDTLATTVKDRIFLTWSGIHGQTVAATITAQAAQITTDSDRIVWCYNSPKTRDPKTGLLFDQGPHIWLASIISQTHPSVHKGSHTTKQYLAGVASVGNDTLTRQDLISLRAAGISTLEHLEDGFCFHSVVTTDLTPGKTELSRRLMTDYIQISMSKRLVSYVKDKNTKVSRAQEVGEIHSFLLSLQEEGPGKTIDDDDPDLGPGFDVDKNSVNTGRDRGQGIEKTLTLIRLVGHRLYDVLETEIGTGTVTIL